MQHPDTPNRGPSEDLPGAVGEWLPLARAGSADALGQLLGAYRNYLLRIARQEIDPALQAKESASDVVQETFLEAQRDFARFHGSSADEWRAWLRQLLLNNVANLIRRYRDTDKRRIDREVPLRPSSWSGTPGGELAADTSSPSSHVRQDEQAQALDAALERLPDEYRQVLHARYREGRSFADIAQQLGRSANAVRKLWARAVARLQEELASSRTEEPPGPAAPEAREPS
jgi:RNA polymerase sigma-70 factor (ECF subfamily)